MAANPIPGTNVSVTSLVTGIIDDAQGLIRQQFTLFKQEIHEDVARIRHASIIIGVGVGVGLLGGILLTFMLVYLLNWAVPQLPLWACYAIVGGLMAVVGGIFCFRGISEIKSITPIPKESMQALKENLQWKTAPY